MAKIIEVTPDCALGGYMIHVSVPSTSHGASVARHHLDTGGLTPVRGLQKLPGNTEMQIIDYEAPLSSSIYYILYEDGPGYDMADPNTWGDRVKLGDTLNTLAPDKPFDQVCGTQFYLRWLFDPEVMSNSFCLGPIEEVDYAPRAGVFTIIGRRDPIVVVDSQETARGTIRFISRTRGELGALRALLAVKAQSSLLQLPAEYGLGNDGLLYFQPLQVRERWLHPDGRKPFHAFDIDFVQISPPAMTESLRKAGIPFGLELNGVSQRETYVHGGWIVYDTDPPGNALHGDHDDRWPSFEALMLSQKTFGNALFDVL